MSRKTVRTPVVEFARGPERPRESEGVVRRRGVIFRAGSYPDQQFSMTPDELRGLAASFSGPIKIDHGHPTADGPIDFGALEAVEASDDGTTLFGTTATPAWLDRALGDARWLVSASFDRATKAIRRLSLVTRPQISDAELQAAFACACNHEAETTTTQTEDPPMDEKTRKARALALVESMDEDDLAVMLGEAAPEADDELDPADDAGTSDFSEAAALRAEIETLKADRRKERAAAFAAELKQAGRIAPFEEATTAAVMFSAMSDDDAIGDTVDFSVGSKAARGTREAMVRAAYGQRMPHGKTAEQITSFSRVLDNAPAAPETDEQYAARVNSKYLGRSRVGGNGTS